MQQVAVLRCSEVLRRVYKQRASMAQADWHVPMKVMTLLVAPVWFLDLVTHVSQVAYPFVPQRSRQFLGPLPALSRPVTANGIADPRSSRPPPNPYATLKIVEHHGDRKHQLENSEGQREFQAVRDTRAGLNTVSRSP
jgi:hypothetical protein